MIDIRTLILAGDRKNTSNGSVAYSSLEPSLRASEGRESDHQGTPLDNYSTYRLDEGCSVVDKSMKWEGFGGIYQTRAPFVAERSRSRDADSPSIHNRSPIYFKTNDLALPTPPRTPTSPSTPSIPSNQHLLKFKPRHL